MKTRVERVSLSITPLAPLHLGCGTDFDPTEYVILDGLLYKFDPSRIPLTDTERREIVAAANLGGAKALIRIQAFFHAKAKACMGNATLAIPVSKGLESQYQSRIGRVAQYEPDREFVNRLVIERTAHHPHTGIPYLPGSGIKGAMRTAWLNRLNGGRIRPEGKRWQELQTELLGGGKFETDPFRLISISDASGSQVISRVVFHTNHRKTPSVGPDGLPRLAKGLAVRREGIVHGQLGSMQCEIGIDSLQGRDGPGTPSVSIRLRDWADLAKACNDYFVPRFLREAGLLRSRQLASPTWLKSSLDLIANLRTQFDAGDAVLLRLGRHSGSENITLDGARRIAIRMGGGQKVSSTDGGTTLWLAADNEGDSSGMHPLGWVLLHRQAYDAISQWGTHFEVPDLKAVWAALATAREEAWAEAAEKRRQAALKAEQDAERAAQLQRDRELLASLSDNGRLVEELRSRLNNHNSKKLQPISGELYQKTRELIALADRGNWLEEDRRRLGELLRVLVPQKIDLASKAKEVKQAANRLLGLQ